MNTERLLRELEEARLEAAASAMQKVHPHDMYAQMVGVCLGLAKAQELVLAQLQETNLDERRRA